MTKVAVLTIVHGRHDHLAAMLDGCARSLCAPDLMVVVAMDDPAVETQVRHAPLPTRVRRIERAPGGLPLAAARNLAARTALEQASDVLVFLDVDCIPGPSLIGRYRDVVEAETAQQPVVVAGEVGYLPPTTWGYRPEELAQLGRPHPARPVLTVDEVRVADDLDLFWSLSFAMSARSWRTVGGFDEQYVGYGGEDTDFAMRIRAAGGSMVWAGGATAYHQHHPSENPPVGHLHDIVRNAHIFRRSWGRWPMVGWLEEFARRGLVRFDGDTLEELRVTQPGAAATGNRER